MAETTPGGANVEPSAVEVRGYHAHVYFGPGSVTEARALYERIPAAFPKAALGRFHERPVGPHPAWTYQIVFGPEQFGAIVPWLSQQRGTLDILVHGLSGDDIRDHTALTMWLGRSYSLDLSAL